MTLSTSEIRDLRDAAERQTADQMPCEVVAELLRACDRVEMVPKRRPIDVSEIRVSTKSLRVLLDWYRQSFYGTIKAPVSIALLEKPQ